MESLSSVGPGREDATPERREGESQGQRGIWRPAGDRALAFLDPHNIKDDAFWAFASARLVDFILWADLAQTEVEFLNRVHLGRGLGPCREAEQIAHRFFENGLVVLNHSREDRQLRLRVASELAGAELLDLYDGNKSLPLDEGVLEVRVPAQAARIFVVQERD